MYERSRHQRGAALVEIVIVVTLSSLLIGLFLHADLAVNRSIMRWTFRCGLEQAAIGLRKQIRRDLDYCDSLRLTGKSELQIFHSDTAVVVYSTSANTITRNGRALLPPEISFSDFSLTPWNTTVLTSTDAFMIADASVRILSITLRRDNLATQTLMLPIRPYSTRQIL